LLGLVVDRAWLKFIAEKVSVQRSLVVNRSRRGNVLESRQACAWQEPNSLRHAWRDLPQPPDSASLLRPSRLLTEAWSCLTNVLEPLAFQ